MKSNSSKCKGPKVFGDKFNKLKTTKPIRFKKAQKIANVNVKEKANEVEHETT